MKRLLFISHRVPYPPDKGERVRAFHEIRTLSERFGVTLAALAHSPADFQAGPALGQWCQTVLLAPAGGAGGLCRGLASLLAGRSVTEGFFASRKLAEAVAREARREPFDLVVGYSSSVLPYVLAAGAASAAARIMDLVDADSAKWDGLARLSRGPKRWLYRREARTVRALEQAAVDHCNAVVLVSRAEAQLLDRPTMEKQVHAIGNGVDVDYFAPAERPADSKPSLVFTGTMDYRPNVDGVCWFAREVWPNLKRQFADLTFTIVGRDPAAAVRRLADAPGVLVTGSVPDVRPFLASATAAVVPLRLARGIQNKVLEAMACGRAVLASPAALEGLDVQAGREALAADSPEQWRQRVAELIEDVRRRTDIERAARACVLARYRWADRLAPLVALCDRLVAGQPIDPLPLGDGRASVDGAANLLTLSPWERAG